MYAPKKEKNRPRSCAVFGEWRTGAKGNKQYYWCDPRDFTTLPLANMSTDNLGFAIQDIASFATGADGEMLQRIEGALDLMYAELAKRVK